ncbi:FeoA family protein [Brevibacillus laterosporus]|uniref:Iron transporter FeoA n=2 Tax=Brevibacillus TaxID=55080 RepID=A0A0F7BYX3_BRELA|nr:MULTISPECIES: FeoA family protein [Brevibacillus]AKF93183.1 iron transporter FeoA [Brevibacillus laterosporus]MCR8986515.1 ferrous iron transport protein A [Brevibacillus laterosporus]MCZ0832250.1 FeoA family protein [Brevibacillus halotolerans]GIO03148.1 hypothetical protein J5TS2_38160 [Brevibacillus halotolerans]
MVLADVKAGISARIVDITQVSALVRRRLVDLDIMEGTVVRIKKILPFGGPYTLEAGGQIIGIRRNEAKQIKVVCE